MKRQICLLFLVSVAVLLVNSESSIEVDENGDEYDVKRFNIQGRNLNEGRSQCVEVRRKRAIPSQPQPVYFNDGLNDEMEDSNNESDKINDNDEPPMIFYSPPLLTSATDGEEDEDKEDEDKENEDNDTSEKNTEGEDVTLSYMDNINGSNNNNVTKSDDDKAGIAEKQEETAVNEALEVEQLPQLPILGQLQSDGESVAAIASAASIEDEADTDSIAIIQSHNPPKVNPQTHAIFELVPVKDEMTQANNGGEHKDDDIISGEFDLDFNEELSPVSTSAIWSTGDNTSNGLYNDYDEKPVRVQKINRNRNPVKTNSKKKKLAKKPKRKNKYNNSLRQGLTSGNKMQNKNKKRPNKANNKRPSKTQKPRPGSNTRRRIPNKNTQNMIRRQNKNRNKKIALTNNRYSNFNNRNRIIAKRNKKRKNAEVVDNGENTFTRTFTWTKTGDDDLEESNVNCIIIRKDAPAPTTERPFWNFWGRSTNGARQASADYGLRKRANVRFAV